MNQITTGNPFRDAAEAFVDHYNRVDSRRGRLRRDGPRVVATLPADARSLTTFSPDQQLNLGAMIDDGEIEALRFNAELFVTYRELEGYVPYGYDINDWLRDATRMPSATSAAESLEKYSCVQLKTDR